MVADMILAQTTYFSDMNPVSDSDIVITDFTMFSQNHQIHLRRRAVPKHNLRENNFASNLHCYISTTVGDREAKVQQCSANLQST